VFNRSSAYHDKLSVSLCVFVRRFTCARPDGDQGCGRVPQQSGMDACYASAAAAAEQADDGWNPAGAGGWVVSRYAYSIFRRRRIVGRHGLVHLVNKRSGGVQPSWAWSVLPSD
jgi:hypothetical protein